MTKKRELKIKNHAIYNFIKLGKAWADLFAEWVDNAFDQDAGNADHVTFTIRRDRIEGFDTGRGIVDPNRVAQIGNSESFFHAGNLGQFGVGAKVWLCKGSILHVETVCAGLRHQCTFDLRPTLAALDAKQREIPLLAEYTGKGRKVKADSFTRLILTELRDKKIIVLTSVISELQKMFWPALRSDRSITFIDARRKKTAYKIEPLAPPSWNDKIEFTSHVNGREYHAAVGILSDQIGAYSGLFIGYRHRNILIAKQIAGRAIPPRIHGQIQLGEGWRHTLSNYKDDLVEDKEELLTDIREKAEVIFDLAENVAEEMRLKNISFQIENLSARYMQNELGDHSTEMTPAGKPRNPNPTPNPNPGPGPKPVPRPKKKATTHAKKRPGKQSQVQGIRINWLRMGSNDLSTVSIDDTHVDVNFNRDCPKIEALTHQPRYPGLLLLIGDALASHCWPLPIEEIEDRFGGMLGAANGSERKEEMLKAIKLWWGFVAEESQ